MKRRSFKSYNFDDEMDEKVEEIIEEPIEIEQKEPIEEEEKEEEEEEEEKEEIKEEIKEKGVRKLFSLDNIKSLISRIVPPPISRSLFFREDNYDKLKTKFTDTWENYCNYDKLDYKLSQEFKDTISERRKEAYRVLELERRLRNEDDGILGETLLDFDTLTHKDLILQNNYPIDEIVLTKDIPEEKLAELPSRKTDTTFLKDEDVPTINAHVFSALRHFKDRIILAGGFLWRELVNHKNHHDSYDFDLFIVNHTDIESAEETIRQVCLYIIGKYMNIESSKDIDLDDLDYNGIVVLRGKDSTNLIINNIKIQFIHRLYPNPFKVIAGFDLPTSKFYTDGYKVYGTPAAVFALQSGWGILDPERLSPSFWYRVIKYQKIGYTQFFLPYSSKSKFLRYYPSNVMPPPFIDKNKWLKYKSSSKKSKDINLYMSSVQKNVLFPRGNLQYYRIYGYYNIFINRDYISPDRTIFQDYRDIESTPLADNQYNSDRNLLRLAAGQGDYLFGRVNPFETDSFKNPIPEFSFEKGPLKTLNNPSAKNILKYHPEITTLKQLNKVLDALLDSIRKGSTKVDIRPSWITKNPGSQWTSSYHPTPKTFKEWYGPIHQ